MPAWAVVAIAKENIATSMNVLDVFMAFPFRARAIHNGECALVDRAASRQKCSSSRSNYSSPLTELGGLGMSFNICRGTLGSLAMFAVIRRSAFFPDFIAAPRVG